MATSHTYSGYTQAQHSVGVVTTNYQLTSVDTHVNGNGTLTIAAPVSPSAGQSILIGNVGSGSLTFTAPGIIVTVPPAAYLLAAWTGAAWTVEAVVGAITVVYRTYATLNPVDKAAGVSLFSGDLQMSGLASVRSTLSVSSGKWYWEVTLTESVLGVGLDTVAVGIANASANLGNPPGFDVNGWAILDGDVAYHSTKANAFAFAAYGTALATGAVIGVALDMDAGTLKFYIDGVDQGVAYSGITGTVFACVGQANTTSRKITANFGASAFSHTPPAGFLQGLYV